MSVWKHVHWNHSNRNKWQTRVRFGNWATETGVGENVTLDWINYRHTEHLLDQILFGKSHFA
jgi:hypothetical protein